MRFLDALVCLAWNYKNLVKHLVSQGPHFQLQMSSMLRCAVECYRIGCYGYSFHRSPPDGAAECHLNLMKCSQTFDNQEGANYFEITLQRLTGCKTG